MLGQVTLITKAQGEGSLFSLLSNLQQVADVLQLLFDRPEARPVVRDGGPAQPHHLEVDGDLYPLFCGGEWFLPHTLGEGSGRALPESALAAPSRPPPGSWPCHKASPHR